MLRDNGKLLLFVPFEKERKYRRYDPVEPNNHLYSWNVQTLGNLVESSGFKVAKGIIGRFGYDRFAAVWAARLGLPQTLLGRANGTGPMRSAKTGNKN